MSLMSSVLDWLTGQPRVQRTVFTRSQITDAQAEEMFAHMDASFAKMDEAFAEMHKAFNVLRKAS